ncbi:phage tail sheath C-terminal domain-containing protein [Francisella philomiragia]|uniref:Phage tail sheath subtilisin-like domain-containing protein n=1 Tax=Francisella philomiragia TaxID=28110 RepID=A0ABS1GD27_9GAMM|nr:phage tail sheath C-terminal domain-containing protein [Francisella philomiragia]MBK2258980.1 phage tail sheath subtilisin-like domain-containing protein [Francisella philomiragia]MBK2302671.1 phage tail sheath subtilisin-like domain-containing protein [Francisella philomiragia]
MSFFHGVEVVEVQSGSRPITTVRSSVIGLVGTADSADASVFPLDTPVLIAGLDNEKIAALGADGTLPEAMVGILASRVGAMVVVIRVAEDADPATQLANIIGGVDVGTGIRTGIAALLDAQAVVKLTPKILIAPSFTNEVNVINAFLPVANSLKAIVLAEAPSTTETDAISYAANFVSDRIYVVDPRVQVTKAGVETLVANSPYVAGHIVRIDHEYGWHYSPSNHVIYGINGTERAIEYDGTATCRANYLNENKVAAVIFDDGFRLWGNYTLAATADKFQFLAVRRSADMINESVKIAHKWAVDRGITKTLLEDVVMNVNNYLRELTRQEKILGGKCWADPASNPASEIENGKLVIDFDFTAVYPAQHIQFRSRLTNEYIEEIFR